MKYSAPATTGRMAGIFVAPLQIGGDSPVELHPEHTSPPWSVEETDACFIVRDCPASFLLFKVYDAKLTRGHEVGRSQKWHGGPGGSTDIPDRLLRALRYALARFLSSSLLNGLRWPEIVSYAITSFCPTSADGLQPQQAQTR